MDEWSQGVLVHVEHGWSGRREGIWNKDEVESPSKMAQAPLLPRPGTQRCHDCQPTHNGKARWEAKW